MKFVALISGGKDSLAAAMLSMRAGHLLTATAHLTPPPSSSPSSPAIDASYMYQYAGSEVVRALAEECLGVPHHERPAPLGPPGGLSYEPGGEAEVEALHALLAEVQDRHPEVRGVSCGAVYSTYQRVRVESVCARLGLTVLAPLWRRAPPEELLDLIVGELGVEAKVVRTACPPGLRPGRDLGKELGGLRGRLTKGNERYGLHVCGEGGEYETLVVDCPIYRRRLVLEETEVLLTDGDLEEGCGRLMIKRWTTRAKNDIQDTDTMWQQMSEKDGNKNKENVKNDEQDENNEQGEKKTESVPSPLPHAYLQKGGLSHTSLIVPPRLPNSTTQTEMQWVLSSAQKLLLALGCTPQDVLSVHLYLADISKFASVNHLYLRFFGSSCPPSRSCVGLGPDAGFRVAMDLLVQRGSGAFLRRSPETAAFSTVPLRSVLHVQSRSTWAPACVGPYAQYNAVRGCLSTVAGQIGLDPFSMTPASSGWNAQLRLAVRHAAAVLDAAAGGALWHALGAVIYLDSDQWDEAASVVQEAMRTNGGVLPGAAEGRPSDEDPLDGYEDEETRRECEGDHPPPKHDVPLLAVRVAGMPVASRAETEITLAATPAAAASLGIFTERRDLSVPPLPTSASPPDLLRRFGVPAVEWDSGHEAPAGPEAASTGSAAGETAVRYVPACGAVVWTTLRVSGAADAGCLLRAATDDVARAARTANMRWEDVLHVRMFVPQGADVQTWGESLAAELGRRGGRRPAQSLVPVMAIEGGAAVALQTTVCDVVRGGETELWVHGMRG